MRCSASAASVPNVVASTAVQAPTTRLFWSAPIANGSSSARWYQRSERPRSSPVRSPALKLNRTTRPIGTYRNR